MLRAETVRLELAERIESDQLAVGTSPSIGAEARRGARRLPGDGARSLRSLEKEGLVRRVQGSGTYVGASSRPQQPGHEFRRRPPRSGKAVCAPASSKHGTGSKRCRRARREDSGSIRAKTSRDRPRRTADDRPVVASRDVLPLKLLGGRDDIADTLAAGSIYDVLEDELGITIQYGIANSNRYARIAPSPNGSEWSSAISSSILADRLLGNERADPLGARVPPRERVRLLDRPSRDREAARVTVWTEASA